MVLDTEVLRGLLEGLSGFEASQVIGSVMLLPLLVLVGVPLVVQFVLAAFVLKKFTWRWWIVYLVPALVHLVIFLLVISGVLIYTLN